MREGFEREKLARKLLLRGISPVYIQSTMQELAEHWEDLREESLATGASSEQAEEYATKAIGDTETLAACITERLSKATWFGRHPVLLFFLCPLLSLIIWWAGYCLIAGWSSGAIQWSRDKSVPPDWAQLQALLEWGATGAAVLLPLFFCWVASRISAGFKCAFLACFLIAIHAAFHFAQLTPSPTGGDTTFTMGYTARSNFLHNNVAGFAMPILVFVLFVLFRLRMKINNNERELMKNQVTMALCAAGVICLTGCASGKMVQERGWVGGELARAEAPSWKTPTDDPKIIGAFPEELRPQYKKGLVITRLSPESPLGKAGLRECDLILAVNATPVTSVESFRKQVDEMPPGTGVSLLVYRDGKTSEHNLKVGKESYRNERNITAGIGLSSHFDFDLLPSPDFSLVALGFKRTLDRLELDSPERRFIRTVQPARTDAVAAHSLEGWRAWMPIFSFSSHKVILTQEPVEAVALR